jgi:hypothetical protein
VTDDVNALGDIAAVTDDADETVLSDEDVDAMEAESTTRKKSRKKKEDTIVKDKQLSIKLGYTHWIRDNMWLAGKQCLATYNVKQRHFEEQKRLSKKRKRRKRWRSFSWQGKTLDTFDKE